MAKKLQVSNNLLTLYKTEVLNLDLLPFFNCRVYCSICFKPDGHGNRTCYQCGGKTTDKGNPTMLDYFRYGPTSNERINFISIRFRGTGSYRQHFEALSLAVANEKGIDIHFNKDMKILCRNQYINSMHYPATEDWTKVTCTECKQQAIEN